MPILTTMPSHKTINDIISVVVVLFAVFLLASPILPYIKFGLSKNNSSFPAYVSQPVNNTNPIPDDNRLLIPSIKLNEPILEGPTESTVHKGVWHLPYTPTPAENGNSVLVGHRFSYIPSTKIPFYFLDKVAVGDEIAIAWDKKIYTYKVIEVKVVPATATEVEANTTDKRLTLYTCTPLWTAKDRLVVVALPTKEAP